MTLIDQHRRSTAPGKYFEQAFDRAIDYTPPVRLVAYYLPQFHPIPLNDAAWGKGFTEWTNVSKATPQFGDHYQPHLPGDLGFYDLRIPDVIRQQAELASKYGINGFCLHHYWFNGVTLMDAPLKTILADKSINLNFCLNWANENWTRRWDGRDHDVLIGQNHSEKDDLAFARSIESALADPRYIRVNGRPLLMVYRPSKLPNAKATMNRWREHFMKVGLGDPFLVMSQALEGVDPREFGMDAAAGFPPHLTGFPAKRRRRWLKLTRPTFTGTIAHYDDMVRRTIKHTPTEYIFLPGVCPSWDNSARRGKSGHVFQGSTPSKYGSWLEAACRFVSREQPADQRIVFINAWNEWGEGAHLEPDRHFGHAYLAETSRALQRLQLPAGG